MSATHTPLPWVLENNNDLPPRIDSPGHKAVVDFHLRSSRPDAEFIVKACNSHYDMLAALEGVDAQLVPILSEERWSVSYRESIRVTLNRVRAAIAKAKGTSDA